MVFDLKPGVTFKRVDQRTQITFRKFGHTPAPRTDDAMGMGVRTEDVAVALTESVDALHDAHIGVQLEGTEKAGVAEWRALMLKLFFKLRRTKRPRKGARCMEHGKAGRGQFISGHAEFFDGVVKLARQWTQ